MDVDEDDNGSVTLTPVIELDGVRFTGLSLTRDVYSIVSYKVSDFSLDF